MFKVVAKLLYHSLFGAPFVTWNLKSWKWLSELNVFCFVVKKISPLSKIYVVIIIVIFLSKKLHIWKNKVCICPPPPKKKIWLLKSCCLCLKTFKIHFKIVSENSVFLISSDFAFLMILILELTAKFMFDFNFISMKILVKGVLHLLPQKAPKLAFILCYILKLSTYFWKIIHVSYSKLIVCNELKNSIKIKVGQTVLELLIQKQHFDFFDPKLLGLLTFHCYFWVPWTVYYKIHNLLFKNLIFWVGAQNMLIFGMRCSTALSVSHAKLKYIDYVIYHV